MMIITTMMKTSRAKSKQQQRRIGSWHNREVEQEREEGREEKARGTTHTDCRSKERAKKKTNKGQEAVQRAFHFDGSSGREGGEGRRRWWWKRHGHRLLFGARVLLPALAALAVVVVHVAVHAAGGWRGSLLEGAEQEQEGPEQEEMVKNQKNQKERAQRHEKEEQIEEGCPKQQEGKAPRYYRSRYCCCCCCCWGWPHIHSPSSPFPSRAPPSSVVAVAVGRDEVGRRKKDTTGEHDFLQGVSVIIIRCAWRRTDQRGRRRRKRRTRLTKHGVFIEREGRRRGLIR